MKRTLHTCCHGWSWVRQSCWKLCRSDVSSQKQLAQDQGIDQLIWTADARNTNALEEAGTMNMMVVINNKLITPPLTTTILDGVTRDSFLALARDAGVEVEERRVMISEVMDAIHQNKLQELFGVGTAATIAHVEKLTWEDECHTLPPVAGRKVSVEIGQHLLAIKKGQTDDIHGWNMTF
ncbi:MAG: aminotransferase class IV [Flavobacteriales bacterium]